MKRKLLFSLMLLCVSSITVSAQTQNAQQMKQINSAKPVTDEDWAKHAAFYNYKVINKDTVFLVADSLPKFPGGNDSLFYFIRKNVNFTNIKDSLQKGDENHSRGRVLIEFYVAKDGSLKNIHVERGFSPDADMEALRVFNMMPKWKPAIIYGRQVCLQMVFPIIFVR
jgi:cytochrome b involved in lipid metabolism